ncbi:MAG TPA: DUF5818 domain-containing protein [Egibacteraceae bacterium]|nr:DUF5818 domain-containing protein [Egibacteraceae bacterium]
MNALRAGSRPGRILPAGWLGGLIALAAASVLLAACGGARGVTLTELAHNAPDYDGRQVATSGIVLEFGDDEGPVPHHFVLQDADVNRVELLPDEAAAPYVGSAVRVVGEFRFDENRGRMLHVESIEPVTAGR